MGRGPAHLPRARDRSFPNLFIVTGPGSPSVLSNMPPSIEQHVDWIADCIRFVRARGLSRIEPTDAAEEAWVAHVNEVASALSTRRAIRGISARTSPASPGCSCPTSAFRRMCGKCAEEAAAGYQSFALN